MAGSEAGRAMAHLAPTYLEIQGRAGSGKWKWEAPEGGPWPLPAETLENVGGGVGDG